MRFRTPSSESPPGLSAPAVRRESAIASIGFVSTFPPRRCGIATFTGDLSRATGDFEIAAIDAAGPAPSYPGVVRHRIRRDTPGDYGRVARQLGGRVDVVSIQHEYGIWGGEDGESVLDFVRALPVPAVATLHTVLRTPTARQRLILAELVRTTSATVVMSRAAANLMTHVYAVDPTKLVIIPHGVPDLPLVRAHSVKPSFGLAGRDVILSFGLLGPGKGYELAIDALPAVVERHPKACYVILGATHPELVRHEGERYRESLVRRAAERGMTGHVRFVDRFVALDELVRWLESADVFVTPYPNLDQIVSGTLSYAMAAGRAVVSTPYTYAAELLADDRGVLVAPGSPAALAAAFNGLLADDDRRAALGRRAYAHSRSMIWSQVGAAYRRVFGRVTNERVIVERATGLAAQVAVAAGA